jgi:hypothetical protein
MHRNIGLRSNSSISINAKLRRKSKSRLEHLTHTQTGGGRFLKWWPCSCGTWFEKRKADESQEGLDRRETKTLFGLLRQSQRVRWARWYKVGEPGELGEYWRD